MNIEAMNLDLPRFDWAVIKSHTWANNNFPKFMLLSVIKDKR